MHLGGFFWLPEQKNIPEASWPKHWYRNPGMFNHPVVIIDINDTTGQVTFRSVTSVRTKADRQGKDIGGADRMRTRVVITPNGGYKSEADRDQYTNEHQMTDSYCLHADSINLQNRSEIIIAEGLSFDVVPSTLRPLGWAKNGQIVRLDDKSTKRLVNECPWVRGPASSPRRGSSSTSSSDSSSPSPSPSPAERRPLALKSVNVPSPATRSKTTPKAKPWEAPGPWTKRV